MTLTAPRLDLFGVIWQSNLCLPLVLLTGLLVTTMGFLQVEEKLKDVVVQVGDKARFLCMTTSHLNSHLPVSVYWTFQGRRLDIYPGLEEEAHYMSYDKNQDLVINKVRAEDEGEYTCVLKVGDQTNSATGRLSVQRPPEPPVDVRVKSCHGNSADITWLAGKSNGAEILSYTVQFNMSEKPEAWYDFYEEISGGSNQVYVDLSPYGTYAFRVIARNAFGASRPSSVTARECTTPPDRPDRNPRNVRTRTDKKGFLVIEWEPLHRLFFHGPGFSYFVYWRSKGSLAWNTATVNGTYASRFEQEVEDVYGCYEFKVKSQNDMGDAHQPAFTYLGRSFEAEPTVQVQGFQLDERRQTTANTAHFVWESIDPQDSKIRGKFRGYKLLYWRLDEEEKDKKEVYIPLSGSSLKLGQEVRGSISDLPAYSTFKVEVVVVNSHYQGPPCQPIDVYTPEGTPSTVQGLFVTAVTNDSVTLRWLPPERPNGMLTGFDIGYQPVLRNQLGPLITVAPVSESSRRLQARVGELKANHLYRFHIVARTQAGYGERAYIDVRTANYTAAKPVTSGNSMQKEPIDNRPNEKLHSSAGLSQTNVYILVTTAILTCRFSHHVFQKFLYS